MVAPLGTLYRSIPLENVSEVVGKSLANVLKCVRGQWQPYDKFITGHWQLYTWHLSVRGLAIPTDYLREGID